MTSSNALKLEFYQAAQKSFQTKMSEHCTPLPPSITIRIFWVDISEFWEFTLIYFLFWLKQALSWFRMGTQIWRIFGFERTPRDNICHGLYWWYIYKIIHFTVRSAVESANPHAFWEIANEIYGGFGPPTNVKDTGPSVRRSFWHVYKTIEGRHQIPS